MMRVPKKIFVVPVPGGLVRLYPGREVMPPEGAYVPDDIYWNRRLLHADVVPGVGPQGDHLEPAPSPVESIEDTIDKKRPRRRDPNILR